MTTLPRLPELVATFDWSSTSLGPRESWPPGLRTVVNLLLSNAFPMIVLWGEDLIQIYNDGYAVILGARHPGALGQPTREVWPEVWHINEPLYDRVRRGETVYFENQLYPITRGGRLEEAYFTLSYSPVHDETGQVGGVLVTVTETTPSVLGLRRLKVRRDLADRLAKAGTLADVRRSVAATQEAPDVPFAELYLNGDAFPAELAQVVRARQPGQLDWPPGGASRPALALPLTDLASGEVLGVLVAGLPSASPHDAGHGAFLEQYAQQVLAALVRVQAETALRASEERQAFLLRLSDALRAKPDERSIKDQTVQMLAEHLCLDRCWISEVFEREGISTVGPEQLRPDLPPVSGVFRLADYPETMRQLATQPMVIQDAASDPRFSDAEKALLAALHLRSLLVVALRKGPRQVLWALAVAMATPRSWTDGERTLLEEVAERTWAAAERARAEAALRQSEEKFRTLSETAPALIWHNDARGENRFVNQQFLDFTGMTAEEIRGAGWHTLVHPDEREAYVADYLTAVRERRAWSAQSRIRRCDGEWRWFDHAAQPLFGEGGTYLGHVGVTTDITERRVREREQEYLLKLSDALRPLSSALDIQQAASRVLGDALGVDRAYYVDIEPDHEHWIVADHYVREGVPPLVGRGRVDDFGWAGKELCAGRVLRLSNTDTDPNLSDSARAEFRSVNVAALLAVPLVKEGRWSASFAVQQLTPREWSEAETKLLQETAERTWAAVERAKAETALRQSEEKYRTLFDSIDEGLAIVEMIPGDHGEIADMIFRQVNAAYERQGGLSNVVGRSVSEVLPGVEEVWLGRYRQVARTGVPLRVEDYQQDVGRWFEVYFSRVDHAGRFVAIVFNDISERKRAEEVLRASEERQAFLLMLSDRLRTEVDERAIATTSVRLLAEHLRLDRAYVAQVDKGRDRADIGPEYRRPDLAAVTGVLTLSEFPEAFARVEAATLVLTDTAADSSLSELDRRGFAELRMGALIVASARKGTDNPVWALLVASEAPRRWTAAEVALVEEVAERTWAATQRARTEAALQASEERYRSLFETMAEGFAVCGVVRGAAGQAVDLRYLELNRALERQTGLDRQRLIGRTLSEVLPKSDLERWMSVYTEVIDSGAPLNFEEYAEVVDRWFAVSVYRRAGDELAVFYRDVTERKRRELNAALLDEIGKDLSVLVTPDEIIERVGMRLGASLNVSGCIFADVDEDDNQATIHHGWNTGDVPSLRQTFRLADYFGEEFARAGRAGETVVVYDTAHDERANAQAYAELKLGAFVTVPFRRQGRWTANITVTSRAARAWRADEIELVREVAARVFPRIERARAEQALGESEGRLRALIEHLPGGAVFVVDHDLRYLLAQGEALAATGYRPEALVGRTVAQAMAPELDAEYEARYRQALAGEGFEYEHAAHGRTFVTRGVPLRNAAGSIYAALAVSYDVTERKRAEEEVQALNATLEARVEERTRRMADLNSELRALAGASSRELSEPLRRLRGFLQLLERRVAEKLDAQTRRFFQLVQQEAQRAERLAENFTALAHLENRALKREQVALTPLMVQVRSDLAPVIRGKAVKWSVGYLPVVEGDAMLLRQAFTDLLHHALKLVPDGVEAQLGVAAEPSMKEVRVVAALTPLKAQEVDLNEDGLATARRVVQRHGGTLSVERQGACVRFVVHLLAQRPPA